MCFFWIVGAWIGRSWSGSYKKVREYQLGMGVFKYGGKLTYVNASKPGQRTLENGIVSVDLISGSISLCRAPGHLGVCARQSGTMVDGYNLRNCFVT